MGETTRNELLKVFEMESLAENYKQNIGRYLWKRFRRSGRNWEELQFDDETRAEIKFLEET